MSERVRVCGHQTYKDLPGAGFSVMGTILGPIRIYLSCQRERGHPGEHAALSMNGFLTWADITDAALLARVQDDQPTA